MKYTLAFDVYGTLINTSGVLHGLEKFLGQHAREFMELWRNKQLEYSFRRGLMGAYVDFSICTAQALEYCCLFHHIDLEKEQKEELMKAYSVLPAYDDVENALQALDKLDCTQYAFSNGSTAAVSGLLENAGISNLFHGIVSVEATRTFKPNPVVYRHFNEQTNSKKEQSCLISGNPFDVMGAISYGMHAIWVQRFADSIFDPWEYKPTTTIRQLGDLPSALNGIP